MVQGYRPPTPPLERLAAKSIQDGDCFLWQGYRQPDGYGRMQTGSRIDGSRRAQAVHRVAWREYHGYLPDDMDVDHLCKRRNCWARAHLRLLTPAQNRHASPEQMVKVRVALEAARDRRRQAREAHQ